MPTTLTVADYEAAALGDRVRNMMSIIDMLQGFDLSKLTELVGLVKVVNDATTIRDKIKAGIDVLAIVATMTATDQDDKMVAMVKSILTDDVLDILGRILGGMLGSMTAQDVTICAADRQKAMAAGIPWAFLVQIALQLLPLIERSLKK